MCGVLVFNLSACSGRTPEAARCCNDQLTGSYHNPFQSERQAHDISCFQHIVNESNKDELQRFRGYLEHQDKGLPDLLSSHATTVHAGALLLRSLDFYIEVQRFKALCHSNGSQHMIQSKVGVIPLALLPMRVQQMGAIIRCFLDSAVPPQVQIDVPEEVAQAIRDKGLSLVVELRTHAPQRRASPNPARTRSAWPKYSSSATCSATTRRSV